MTPTAILRNGVSGTWRLLVSVWLTVYTVQAGWSVWLTSGALGLALLFLLVGLARLLRACLAASNLEDALDRPDPESDGRPWPAEENVS